MSYNLLVKEQRAGNIAQRIADKSSSSIYGFLGVTARVRGSQTNTLDPSCREKVEKVKTKDLCAFIVDFPAAVEVSNAYKKGS